MTARWNLSSAMAMHGRMTYTSHNSQRSTSTCDGDIRETIQEAALGEPLAVWLLDHNIGRRLKVNQFVLLDSHILWNSLAHQKLQEVCGAWATLS